MNKEVDDIGKKNKQLYKTKKPRLTFSLGFLYIQIND